ncbi:hypothetical protein B0I37DRAFT_357144 [Chaetomium sp. MPI-CAGE-AT-0009]|nr:hypothetical protein B0I37DRAFT_357144 [Chaetomium sp. MPI-CAGE-AT-0009]
MMRSPFVILNFAASAAAAAISSSLPASAPLPIGEVGWEGAVVPGEPAIVVWGDSFEDIEAKLQSDHPGFSIYQDEANVDEDGGFEETSEDPALVARGLLEARADWGKHNCLRGGWTYMEVVNSAIKNLNNIKGDTCRVRARKCVRMQCVKGSGVGVCNDNRHDIKLACTQVARMARHILLNCHKSDTICGPPGVGCIGTIPVTQGQVFSAEGKWNTIVGRCTFWGDGPERPVKE